MLTVTGSRWLDRWRGTYVGTTWEAGSTWACTDHIWPESSHKRITKDGPCQAVTDGELYLEAARASGKVAAVGASAIAHERPLAACIMPAGRKVWSRARGAILFFATRTDATTTTSAMRV